MSYAALVSHFSDVQDFPIQYSDVVEWIRSNTDHKIIELYAVPREKKAYRGAFRRTSVPIGGMYSHEFEILTKIVYGNDLSQDWKNLVITKEALHVFDPPPMQVNTRDVVRDLIPSVIHSDLKSKLLPGFADNFGPYRALPILIPMNARSRLKATVDSGSKSIEEIAIYVDVPPEFVDLWLNYGERLYEACMNY